jgi:hypothetical protein
MNGTGSKHTSSTSIFSAAGEPGAPNLARLVDEGFRRGLGQLNNSAQLENASLEERFEHNRLRILNYREAVAQSQRLLTLVRIERLELVTEKKNRTGIASASDPELRPRGRRLSGTVAWPFGRSLSALAQEEHEQSDADTWEEEEPDKSTAAMRSGQSTTCWTQTTRATSE